MIDATEQKILNAALNELTLFQLIKTKKNLHDTTLIQNIEKLKKDFDRLLVDNKFENNEDFLKTLIKDLVKVTEDNFEVIHIYNEKRKASESLIEEFINNLSEYIEKNIQNNKIDYKALATTIFALTYTIGIGRHQGRAIINCGEIIEGFINNSILCI